MMSPLIEIRSYDLTPGSGAAFDRLFLQESLPLLRSFGVDVVAYGVSAHLASPWSDASRYLIRRYADLDDLERSEAAFYGSAAWREGPRAAVLACIATFTAVAIEVSDATVDGLRSVPDP
jgi:hypothetical protein